MTVRLVTVSMAALVKKTVYSCQVRKKKQKKNKTENLQDPTELLPTHHLIWLTRPGKSSLPLDSAAQTLDGARPLPKTLNEFKKQSK